MVGVSGIDGPAKSSGRRARGVVLVMDLAVACLVIVILGLVILLRAVGVGSGAVVFVFRQQKQVIGGTGDIAGGVGSAAGVVAVLGHRFHHSPQVRRQRSQQTVGGRAGGGAAVAQQGLSHTGAVPPAAVCVAGVHLEKRRGGSAAAVIAIAEGNMYAADLADLEVYPVGALSRRVVIETNNKGING